MPKESREAVCAIKEVIIIRVMTCVPDYADARRRLTSLSPVSVESAMFSRMSVYAAPVSGVIPCDVLVGEILLRFGIAEASGDD